MKNLNISESFLNRLQSEATLWRRVLRQNWFLFASYSRHSRLKSLPPLLFFFCFLFSHAAPDHTWSILIGDKEKKLVGTCYFISSDTFITCLGNLPFKDVHASMPLILWHPDLGYNRIQKIEYAIQDLDILVGVSFSRLCKSPIRFGDYDRVQPDSAKVFAYCQDSTGIFLDSLKVRLFPTLFTRIDTTKNNSFSYEFFILSNKIITATSGSPLIFKDGTLAGMIVLNYPWYAVQQVTCAISPKYPKMIIDASRGKHSAVITPIFGR